jgi:hypothetical protein
MFDVYKPAGHVGFATWPLLLAGIAATVGLGFLYQLLLEWIPYIFISVLITCGLGIVLAMLGGLIVSVGHVRNITIGALIGICLSMTCLSAKYWFQYQRDIDARTTSMLVDNRIPETKRSQVREMVSRQVTWKKHLQDRTAFGWTIDRGGGGGLPIKGVFVYLIWLIEVGIIYYFAAATPTSAAREPYSEQTNKWASESQIIMTLPISNEEMVAKIKMAKSVDDLLELPIPKTDQSNRFAVYTVNSIPGEEMEDAYLSVDLLTYAVNDKGEEENKEQAMVRYAILPTAKREHLVENAELLQEAIADFRASLEEERAETLAQSEFSEDEDRIADNDE